MYKDCSRLGKREARKVISEKELRIDIERTRYFLSNSRISGNFAGGANESSIYIRAYIRVYVYIYINIRIALQERGTPVIRSIRYE